MNDCPEEQALDSQQPAVEDGMGDDAFDGEALQMIEDSPLGIGTIDVVSFFMLGSRLVGQ